MRIVFENPCGVVGRTVVYGIDVEISVRLVKCAVEGALQTVFNVIARNNYSYVSVGFGAVWHRRNNMAC